MYWGLKLTYQGYYIVERGAMEAIMAACHAKPAGFM